MRRIAVGGAEVDVGADRVHHALGVRGDFRARGGFPRCGADAAEGGGPGATCLGRWGEPARPIRRRVTIRRSDRNAGGPGGGARLSGVLRPGPADLRHARAARSSVGRGQRRCHWSVRRASGPMLRIQPFDSMWKALGRHFADPRLRQLFGRYATYCGSSPFLAPATLMLVAHVEQEGVVVRRRRHVRAGAGTGGAGVPAWRLLADRRRGVGHRRGGRPGFAG